jgi:hypothetical protein
VVTAAMRDLAVSYGVPPEAVDGETQKFLDHFAASGELKADWVAAWRNWMRRAPEFAPRRSGSGPARASPNGTGLSRSRPGMTAEETAAFARELERAGL